MKSLELLMKVIDEEWNNIKITFAEPWEIPWMVHAGERDDYEIYFLEKGKGRFVINGVEFPVVKGDVMLLHTKEENSFISDEISLRFVFVTFKIEHPKNIGRISELDRILHQENYPAKLDDPQRVHEIFYQMQKEFCLKAENYMFKVKLLLGELSSNILEQCEKSSIVKGKGFCSNKNAHESINEIIVFLQNNFNRNISLEELGALVNLHPRYLCTLFRQVSGKTIIELLHEIRIEKAKRLLLYTSLSITEIALEVGFSDSQYFNRVFNRYENMAPTAYRNALRK